MFASPRDAGALPRPKTTGRSGSPEASEVVNRYLDAFYRGDFETPRTARRRPVIQRPFVQVDGADQFLASADGLRRIVTGHCTEFRNFVPQAAAAPKP